MYHCQIKTIGRASGRSATAAAAYRSGEPILDERTGVTYDYSHRRGVADTMLILPEGVKMTRSELWNLAEQSEKRKNARVAREVETALPADLNAEQRRTLAHTFGQWLAETYNVAVDVCIHKPSPKGDQRNHHAHIMMTTRAMRADGKLDANKGRTKGQTTGPGLLDDREAGPAEIERIREAWATMYNDALHAAHIHDQDIDHRSYARQGIHRLPTIHEGSAVTALERQGEHTRIRAINDTIRQANALLDAAAQEQTEADRLKKRAKRLRKRARLAEEREQAEAQQAASSMPPLEKHTETRPKQPATPAPPVPPPLEEQHRPQPPTEKQSASISPPPAPPLAKEQAQTPIKKSWWRPTSWFVRSFKQPQAEEQPPQKRPETTPADVTTEPPASITQPQPLQTQVYIDADEYDDDMQDYIIRYNDAKKYTEKEDIIDEMTERFRTEYYQMRSYNTLFGFQYPDEKINHTIQILKLAKKLTEPYHDNISPYILQRLNTIQEEIDEMISQEKDSAQQIMQKTNNHTTTTATPQTTQGTEQAASPQKGGLKR